VSSDREDLHLLAWGPPIVEGDDRLVRVLAILDEFFPGHPLRLELICTGKLPRLRKIEAPEARLRGRADMRPEAFPPESIIYLITDKECWLSFQPYPHGSLPITHHGYDPEFIARAYELTKQACTIHRATIGDLNRSDTGFYGSKQYPRRPTPGEPVREYHNVPPPFGLPVLYRRTGDNGRVRPSRLCWINYWPAETCRLVGAPDPSRDTFLHRAEPLPDGGWLWQLTADPTDLERPEHLAALLAAYDRFPAVGHRAEGPLHNTLPVVDGRDS
jgi:hypothetical protein